MSLVEITAMGPSFSTSVYNPAARRAVAVLMPFSVQDYIESDSEGVVFHAKKSPRTRKLSLGGAELG
jgi:hypothetical protein